MRTTWILVANASEARLFESASTMKHLKLIHAFSHPESRQKAVDLVADLAGRYRNSTATPTGVYEEETHPKEVEAERFAHQLVDKLDHGRTHNLYQSLVVVAPPHFQGLLNRFCNIHIKNLITNTLEKDYTKLKQHELPHYLNGKIAFRKAA